MVMWGKNGENADYFNTEEQAVMKLREIVRGEMDAAEGEAPFFGNCMVYYQTHEVHEPSHQDDDYRVVKLP